MRTSCTNNAYPCQSWRLNGKYTDSGKNFDGVVSELVYQVEMVKSGSLEFAYFVDCELNFDFLVFQIDGIEQFRSSHQLTWKPMFYNLTAGYHVLRWAYSKDYSVSRGEDLAKLQYVSLQGTNDVVIDCHSCPPGSFKSGNMITCDLCPPNQYSVGWGNGNCENCPFGQESFAGATQCFPSSKPCLQSDIYSSFSTCQNNMRTETFSFIKPVLCNVTHPDSITLMPPRSVPCNPHCQLGQMQSNGVCTYCPMNSYKDDSVAQCTMCSTGKSIETENYYVWNWREDDTFFTTGCSGSCKSGGWRMAGNFTDSGLGNGISESWLELNVTMKKIGSILVDFQLSCLEKTGSFVFSIGGQVNSIVECSGCNSGLTTTTIVIPVGFHTIRIAFSTSSGYSSDWTCDRATIKKITIQNSMMIGGGINCKPCPAGTKSTSAYQCTACDPGYFSPQQSTTCSECQNDYFSYKSGSASCQACGVGFMSRSTPRDHCDWIVGENQWLIPFNTTQRMFDWNDLIPKVKDTYYPYKGNFVRLNLDMNPLLCNGFICLVANGTVTSMAEYASLSYNGQVSMNTKSLDSKYNDTRITLWCFPNAGRDFDPTKDVSVIDDEIVIYSQYGCHLCANNDYKANIGVCIGGQRSVVYTKMSYCTRGLVQNITTVECTNTIRISYWVVIGVPLVAIFIGLGGFLLIALLWSRYRKLENEYSQMKDRQKENDTNDDTMDNDEIVQNNVVNSKDVVSNQVDEYDDLKI
jgi:hypothetical protein